MIRFRGKNFGRVTRKLFLTIWALIGCLAGLILAVPLSMLIMAASESPHSGGGDGWGSVGVGLVALVISAPMLAGLGGWQALKLGRRLNPVQSRGE